MISVERNIEMRVGRLVMEMASVIVQYATMVMAPHRGSRTAAFIDSDCGSVSNLFGRKIVEIKERRRLENPDTNISCELEIFFLLH